MTLQEQAKQSRTAMRTILIQEIESLKIAADRFEIDVSEQLAAIDAEMKALTELKTLIES